MESKADRVRKLLKNHKTQLGLPNAAQETYVRKLRHDIERTNTFLKQAREAVQKLEETSVVNELWTAETERAARILALYEAYVRLPYLTMKNDLIGIATAASLTRKAVTEQAEATKQLANENSVIDEETGQLKTILADYKAVLALLEDRIGQHPDRMAELQAKLRDSQPLEVELAQKLASIVSATELAKKMDDRMHQHVKRVVTKLHALLDWENTSMVDESTFKKNILQSLALVNSLVAKLVSSEPGAEKWVHVTPGSADEKLVQVMLRSNLIHVREHEGYEVRLRDFGFEY